MKWSILIIIAFAVSSGIIAWLIQRRNQSALYQNIEENLDDMHGEARKMAAKLLSEYESKKRGKR